MNRRTAVGLLVALVLAACQIPGQIDTARSGYRVFYQPNGSDQGSAPEDPAVYKPGDQVVILGNSGRLGRRGSTFDRWTAGREDSADRYRPGDRVTMPAADLELYPTWSKH